MKENQKSDIAPQDKQWEWIPCQYDVKRISKDTETTWNLSPSVQLKIPSDQGQIDPVIDLKIEQSRNFIYTNKNGLGWNWHKSWNLPDIGVELEITDPTTDEKLAPPGKIYAKIQIVKPTVSPMKTFHLLEVGVKGNQKMDLENNKCIFSGLKFNTTSYNHDHQKFHIIITLYLCQSKFEFPQILISRISPPIFVDSRKSARDIEQQNKQKLQSYFDPFPITTLEKQFTTTKPQNTEVITNTIEGLNNYFSAPNIRHKVKHPVFLCIKFSSCIKLYLNTNVFKFQDSKSLVLTIQQVLYKSTNNNVNNKLDQKYIILCVDSSNTISKFQQHLKKLQEFLEPFNNDDIEVVIDPIELPKNFTQITDLADIKQAYIDVYDKLLQLKKNEQQHDDNQEQEEQPRKKKKPKEQEVVQNNQEKIIRKVIQIQGPNISQQRSHHTHVIQSAEMLIEQQHQYLDKEHVKEEHIIQEEKPHQFGLPDLIIQQTAINLNKFLLRALLPQQQQPQ
ncbi:unnamed protein product [Paramecium primaurelia]|uniref:Uncharacterized protein n=1 Tax=Paramecium primaurelia TaxID=5886 RepID=A0A8S1P9T0_PARPR|nr:unnamed protein product [Paramecium primaurelia]